MIELIAAVDKLVAEELKRANENFPLFHSDHEGYAVIQEEIDEAMSANREAMKHKESAWDWIKANVQTNACEEIKAMREVLGHGIAEMIQIAAMCEKFIQSQEARK